MTMTIGACSIIALFVAIWSLCIAYSKQKQGREGSQGHEGQRGATGPQGLKGEAGESFPRTASKKH